MTFVCFASAMNSLIHISTGGEAQRGGSDLSAFVQKNSSTVLGDEPSPFVSCSRAQSMSLLVLMEEQICAAIVAGRAESVLADWLCVTVPVLTYLSSFR